MTLPMASKNPFVMLWNVLRLVRLIRQNNVALVHARSRAPAWSALAAARWCKVPFICTFHGTYSLKGGALKRFYNSVMLRSSHVIANSQFIKAHIVAHYGFPENRIIVAPRGIAPEVFAPSQYDATAIAAVRVELQVPADTPLLLMVGRISSWKGHALLLHGLALVPGDVPWVVAFAGGDEGLGDSLHALASRLGVADRVRWLGSRNDTPRLLAASTLAFSCSTRPEAFGRVAIESMAMGVPVIATALGGSLETVIDGQTGWLVPPAARPQLSDIDGFAPQTLADKIAYALRNPAQLAKMGQNARQHVLAHYTAEACCQAEAQAYSHVMASHKKG